MGKINIRSYEASREMSSIESGDFRRLPIESRALRSQSESDKWGWCGWGVWRRQKSLVLNGKGKTGLRVLRYISCWKGVSPFLWRLKGRRGTVAYI